MKPALMIESERMDPTPTVVALPVHSIVECRILSESVRFCITNPADHIQEYHLQGKFYEHEQLIAFRNHCPTDRVILDIGANIGNHSIFISKIIKPRRVLPFEVNPEAVSILRTNLALNNCQNVDSSYLGIGLSSREHRMRRAEAFSNNLGGTRFVEDSLGEFVSMPADPLVSQIPVGAIKIDVEGMEYEILKGLTTTVSRWRPTMFIELEDQFAADFASWLNSFQYSVAMTFQPYRGKAEYLAIPE